MSKARLATIQSVSNSILELQGKFGASENEALIEGVCLVLSGMASRFGNQSMECPQDLITQEATAIRDQLYDVFGEPVTR